MKKTLSLLTMLLLSICTAWADDLKVTWALGDDNSTAVADPSDKATGSFVLGSGLSNEGKYTWSEISFTKFQATSSEKASNSHASALEKNQYVDFKLTPVGGSFTPTKVSFDIIKIGTDEPNIWVDCIDGENNTITVAEDVTIRRNETGNTSIGHSFTINGAITSTNTATLRILVGKLANNKQVGIANVVVEGTWNSSAKTITFVNDADWEKVHVWAWNSTENFTGGTWPGVEMTKTEEQVDGHDVYSWSTTGSPTSIKFSNNGSNETSNFEFKDGGKYNSQGRIVEKTSYSATFTTEAEWEHVYAFCWNNTEKENALGAWPGTEITATKDEDGVYHISLEAEFLPEGILFHNNDSWQTSDYVFENNGAYAYNKTAYTVSFTTDAGWENVYAWAWSGSGDNLVNHCAPWPGVELEKTGDVYTFTYKTFGSMPEKILFNGGDDSKKTPDMIFVDGKAYKWITAAPIYAIPAADLEFESGTTIDVKDADGDVVATITYGETYGPKFNRTLSSTIEGYKGYTYCTEGNGTNGDQQGGTFYTIVPKFDGTIDLAVIINKGKTLIVEENGTPLTGFVEQAEKLYGIQSFNVKAGKSYKCYVSASKMGFYGFDYKFTKTASEYYLVGGEKNMAWTLGDALTENEGVYSIEIPYSSEYSFAIVPNTSIYGEEINWKTVIRPESQTEVKFENNSGTGASSEGDQNWKMKALSENESQSYTTLLTYNPETKAWTTSATSTVTISAAGYATYSNAEKFEVAEGPEVYIVKDASTSVKLTEPDSRVLPGDRGAGIILKGSGDVTIKSVDADAETAHVTGNLLVGSCDWSFTFPGGYSNIYILANGNSGVGFYPWDTNATGDEAKLAAHKAFLVDSSGARGFIGFDDGETTAIKGIAADKINNGDVYNLNGQRVAQPTKGLYIVNGKKVIVK